MVLKNSFFFSFFFFRQKAQTFVHFGQYGFGSNITSVWSKYVLNNVWKDLRLPVSAFTTVARKGLNDKLTAKIDFPTGHFMLPLLSLILEV